MHFVDFLIPFMCEIGQFDRNTYYRVLWNRKRFRNFAAEKFM